MKAKIYTKKSGFYKGQKDVVALLKLLPSELTSAQKQAKVKKNISFVIDHSSSMGGGISASNHFNAFNMNHFIGAGKVNPVNPFPQQPDPFAPMLIAQAQANTAQVDVSQKRSLDVYLNGLQPQAALEMSRIRNRLQLVIDATKQAIAQLDEEDFASIVLFDDRVTVLCPAAAMTAANKMQFLNALSLVQTRGSTNLHGGWVQGVTEVAKNLSSKCINRVIILTDGQTNAGETRKDIILSNVAGAYKNSVSTTTIGVGMGFNEDLLQGMSSAGAGNSYFIDSDETVQKTFDLEFTGLSNINATEILLKVEGSGNLKFVKNLNMYAKDGEKFKLPTLTSQEINAVFVFEASDKTLKELSMLKFSLSFKDAEGKVRKLKVEQELSLLSKSKVEELEDDKEVAIQELLNTIAEQKLKAQDEYRKGNISGAKDLLARSSVTASAMVGSYQGTAYQDMLQTESANLMSLSNEADNGGERFSKTLSYQSYRTRNSQAPDSK